MPTKSVSNEDILELLQESMQMTSDNFDRQQAWNEKQQAWNEKFIGELKDIKSTLSQHGSELTELKAGIKRIANEQKAQVNDISDILDRIQALQEKHPDISESEKKEIQMLLQELHNWASLASKNLGIPIKLKHINNGTV
jgi:hypothetical protein